jgi:hypothetical protein
MGKSNNTGNSGVSGTYLQPLPTVDANQQALLSMLSAILGGQMGNGIRPYNWKKLVAPLDTLEQSALARIAGLADSPMARSREDVLSRVLGEELPYTVGPEEYERAYAEGVEAPAMRSWQQEGIPELMHRFGSQGRAGVTLDMLANAGVDLRTNLASQKAQYRLRGAERKMDAAQIARNLAVTGLGESMKHESFPITMEMAGGGLSRSVEQAKRNAKFNMWAMGQDWANPWLGFLPTVLGTPTFTYGGLPYQNQDSGGWGSGLSGVGGILQAFGGS